MKDEMEAKDLAKQMELEAKRKKTEELRAQGITQENKATSKKKKQAQERERERQRLAANRTEAQETDTGEADPSREGHRKFARGRAYEPERFIGTAMSDLDDEIIDLMPVDEAEVVIDSYDEHADLDYDDYDDDFDDEDEK